MGRGERPNILNIAAWKNYLATFDSQQLATLCVAYVNFGASLLYFVVRVGCRRKRVHVRYLIF